MAIADPTVSRQDDRTARGAEGALLRVLLTGPSGRLRADVRTRIEQVAGAVHAVNDLGAALRDIDPQRFDVCVLDLSAERIPPAVVRVLRAQHPAIPLVGIVDTADPLAAGEAFQAGLTDVLPWPFDARDLALALTNVRERGGAGRDNGGSSEPSAGEPLFAQSPAMRQMIDAVKAAAGGRGGVCLTGEPATGRELVARAIHRLSAAGRPRPFVTVECSGDSPQEIESRLFGAPSDRRAERSLTLPRLGQNGAIVAARGGTLYLRNLTELPARVQAALARLLRDREGSIGPRGPVIDLDVRPMAALSVGVEQAIERGELRAELADRLSQARLEVPPLRRRREDIPMLAAWLLGCACRAAGKPPQQFSRSALALLSALPWHGNAEELGGLIDTAVRMVARPVIQVEDLLEYASLDGITARFEAGVNLRDAKARFERDCISAVLRRHHGRVGEAAKALGIQRTNLYRKVRQLNVSRSLLSVRR